MVDPWSMVARFYVSNPETPTENEGISTSLETRASTAYRMKTCLFACMLGSMSLVESDEGLMTD